MNTDTTTNGATEPTVAITIHELAMRPAMQLTRKQFRAVSEYAGALQRAQELADRLEHAAREYQRIDQEWRCQEKVVKELGQTVYGE